jgi:hypothetical protein
MLLDRFPAQPNRAGLGFRAQSVLGRGVILKTCTNAFPLILN